MATKIMFSNHNEPLNINKRSIMRQLRHARALAKQAQQEDEREANKRMMMKNKNPEELEWKENTKELYDNMKKTNMDVPWWLDGGVVKAPSVSAPENDVKSVQQAGENAIKKQTMLQPRADLLEKQSQFERLQKMAHARERALAVKSRTMRADLL